MGIADKLVIEGAELVAPTSVGKAAAAAAERFGNQIFGIGARDSILSNNLVSAQQESGKGFQIGGSIKQRVEDLCQAKLPVDYETLVPKDSKVVLFGETHPVEESREELIANMPQFKQMGFTHLAMEALTKKRQPLLDAYFAGSHPNATKAAIARVLDTDWGWDTPGYARLIEESKANGIRVVAVDKKISATRAGLTRSEIHRGREDQWAQVITDQVKPNSYSRLLMLVGKNHTVIDATENSSLTSILREKELNPFVINLEAPAHVNWRPDFYDRVVKAAGLEGERFGVPVVEQGSRPADFIVNLPINSRFQGRLRDIDSLPTSSASQPA